MISIGKKYPNGDMITRYGSFNIEKIKETKIISREVSKNIKKTQNIILDYVEKYNLKDFELYYNRSFDIVLISYNI